MKPTQMKFGSYRSQVVELKGGLNENVSSLELLGGELLDCRNYMIAEGGYGGYKSVKGYERVDGTTIPSEYVWKLLTIEGATRHLIEGELIEGVDSGNRGTTLADSELVSGTFGVDAIIKVEYRVYPGDGDLTLFEDVEVAAVTIGNATAIDDILVATDDYHAGLDYARDMVIEVPGEGPLLGVHIYENKMYAFRKKVSLAEIGMYVEDATTGWDEVDTSADPIVYSADVNFKFTNYNFYGSTVNPGKTLSMYWIDGVNDVRSYDGLTVDTILNAGMTTKPINIIAHNFYLILAYPGGSLQHSVVGEPDNWSGASGAGEFGMGNEITDLSIGLQNSLIVFMVEGIKLVQGQVYAGEFADVTIETFSAKSGSFPGTAKRLLGTTYFLDDRGMTSLQQAGEFGDYTANSISQKFSETLKATTHDVTVVSVSRDLNQYRIFFDDRLSLWVSFEANELKGATIIEYPQVVNIIANGEDVNRGDFSIFGSEDGFVYRMDSGRSFDGVAITCRMTTGFFHYNSPRQWKAFKRATLEISGTQFQVFDIRCNFNYNEPGSPRSIWYNRFLYNLDGTALYGQGIWGEMKYGASGVGTESLPLYISGVGVNMSYKLISNETYKKQHIIQNIITDFEAVGRRT